MQKVTITIKDDSKLKALIQFLREIDFVEISRNVYRDKKFDELFGIWKDRYDQIIFDKIDFEQFVKNRRLVKKFRKGGEDLIPMLKLEAEGAIDALDVKIFYTQCLRTLYTVSPTISLANNIGHDGTGIHCGVTSRFDIIHLNSKTKFDFDPNVRVNKRVIKTLYRFRSQGHTKKDLYFRILGNWVYSVRAVLSRVKRSMVLILEKFGFV